MECLHLSDGNFERWAWSTEPERHVGLTRIARTPGQITVVRERQGSLTETGDYRYQVFGDLDFVALLKATPGTGRTTIWTVSLVNVTLPTIEVTTVFTVTLPSTQHEPYLARGPARGRLVLFFNGTGVLNEYENIMIVRSDGSDPHGRLLWVPRTIRDITEMFVTARIDGDNLIIRHPNPHTSDETIGTRPKGRLAIVPPDPPDFGEVALGAAEPATRVRRFTLRNDGTDCLSVGAIADDPPFAVEGSPAWPLEIRPAATAEVDVRFVPTAVGDFTRSLPVTRSPDNGDTHLVCRGRARAAEHRITVSPPLLDFETIPYPGAPTRSFTVTNDGDFDLEVDIPAPSGTDFSWAPSGINRLAVGASVTVIVTFAVPRDRPAPEQTITITPSQGAPRQVSFRGSGCVPNAVAVLPQARPIDFGRVERGFRAARRLIVGNDGDGDLEIVAEILPGTDPGHAALFGLVIPGGDISDMRARRDYSILPRIRCGSGPTGSGESPVVVGFHAGAAPAAGPYTAELEIREMASGRSARYPLLAVIAPTVPIDAALVLDRSGSMADAAGSRTKMEAALAAGHLFVQMLRPDAEDRAGIISFSDDAVRNVRMVPVAGNAGLLATALNFTPAGATNIAAGIIRAMEAFDDPPRSPAPPDLRRAIVVLTDGIENRCSEVGGAWYSITGRDPPIMFRPDGTPQETDMLALPAEARVYAVGLGNPGEVDGPALDDLSRATGGSFDQVRDLTGADYFLLEKHFTQIFMGVAGMAMISDPFYTILPGDRHIHEFDIFPGDVSAMVVIYDHPEARLPVLLVSPRGEQVSATSLPPGFAIRFRSTSTARFVELKFPVGEPELYASTASRRWQVVVAHAGLVCAGDINPPDPAQDDVATASAEPSANSAEVGAGFTPSWCQESREPVGYGIAIAAGSNLRLQAYVEPGVKVAGDTIRLNAELAEAGLPLTGATVTVVAGHPDGSSSTLALRDDGGSQDGAADDGDYGGLFVKAMQAGVYQFLFRAEGIHAGRPFVREVQRTKTVHDRRNPPREGPAEGADCCREAIGLIAPLRLILYWLLLLMVLAVIVLLYIAWTR